MVYVSLCAIPCYGILFTCHIYLLFTYSYRYSESCLASCRIVIYLARTMQFPPRNISRTPITCDGTGPVHCGYTHGIVRRTQSRDILQYLCSENTRVHVYVHGVLKGTYAIHPCVVPRSQLLNMYIHILKYYIHVEHRGSSYEYVDLTYQYTTCPTGTGNALALSPMLSLACNRSYRNVCAGFGYQYGIAI